MTMKFTIEFESVEDLVCKLEKAAKQFREIDSSAEDGRAEIDGDEFPELRRLFYRMTKKVGHTNLLQNLNDLLPSEYQLCYVTRTPWSRVMKRSYVANQRPA
ncbi:hypothetical protein EWI61_08985 [Methylolobus aquaticus]|nr:hypothetical protein EWI61_08985 [Methylolobus aquaticus]